jgi:molybdopterin biosynthesis enzyme
MPGRPVMLSVTDTTTTPVLSLPGNPLAAAVNMRSLGLPLLGLSSWLPQPRSCANAWMHAFERLPLGFAGFFVATLNAAGHPIPMPSKKGGVAAIRDLIGGQAWVRLTGAGEAEGHWCMF